MSRKSLAYVKGTQLCLRTKIDEEGIQRSFLDCGNISYSIRPRAFPPVSRHVGTHLTVGVCTSVTRSDLPWGLLFKSTTAFHSPSSFPSFNSSSRCMNIGTIVTRELIRFCGLLPFWSHFCVRLKTTTTNNCFRDVVMYLIGDILRNGPRGRSKLKQKKQRNNLILAKNNQVEALYSFSLQYLRTVRFQLFFKLQINTLQ